MLCTVEKLSSLHQLQVTLHRGGAAPFTPLCTVSNQYPFKPILRVQRDDSGSQTTVIDLPLNVRVDLADEKNRVSHTEDATIISLRFKQGRTRPRRTLSRLPAHASSLITRDTLDLASLQTSASQKERMISQRVEN